VRTNERSCGRTLGRHACLPDAVKQTETAGRRPPGGHGAHQNGWTGHNDRKGESPTKNRGRQSSRRPQRPPTPSLVCPRAQANFAHKRKPNGQAGDVQGPRDGRQAHCRPPVQGRARHTDSKQRRSHTRLRRRTDQPRRDDRGVIGGGWRRLTKTTQVRKTRLKRKTQAQQKN
jgi:hypothetical protein